MKINLGSGYKRFDGFVNVDSDPACNPDHVVDIGKDVWPFDDNTVDEIKAHHVFEHMGGDTFFHMLKEMYRVCSDRAVIDVIVPHFRHDYFYGDPTHVRPISVEMMRRFSKSFNDDELAGNPGTTPFAYTTGVDFEVSNYSYNIEDWFITQYASAPIETVDLAARIYNNVIKEINMTLVVKK